MFIRTGDSEIPWPTTTVLVACNQFYVTIKRFDHEPAHSFPLSRVEINFDNLRKAQSAARCAEMLAEALGGGGRIKKFHRDGWGKPWPAGPEMLCYMLAHEAHHRGQACMLAHQLGFRLPAGVTAGIWNWEKLWKECGSPGQNS